jgi:hypothetical protein
MPVQPHRLLRHCHSVAAALALTALVSAHASTPAEKVVCTQAPRHTWLSEDQAKHIFGASRYLLVRFKVSSGQCHEFYAVEHDGTVVEAYQHPVTGASVRWTRIPAIPSSNTRAPAH